MAKFAAKDSNKNITLSPHGTGKVVVGTGATDATVQSDGNHNLVLQTGNATTGSISITDGADGNIAITPNGTGEVDISKVDIDAGAIDGVTIGTNSAVTDLRVDNIKVDGNTISSTNTDGNIDLTPNGTGEVNISKVDIDSGTVDGLSQLTVDNLQLNANTVSTTNTDGDLALEPNGTGAVTSSKDLKIDTDTLYVDATNEKVGINKTPAKELHVGGLVQLEDKAFTGGHTRTGSLVNINMGDDSTYASTTALLQIKNLGNRGAKGASNGSDLLRGDFSDANGFVFDKSGNLDITGNFTSTGNASVGGTLTSTGAITASGGIANAGTISAGTIGGSVVFPSKQVLQVHSVSTTTASGGIGTTAVYLKADGSGWNSSYENAISFDTKQANSDFLVMFTGNAFTNHSSASGYEVYCNIYASVSTSSSSGSDVLLNNIYEDCRSTNNVSGQQNNIIAGTKLISGSHSAGTTLYFYLRSSYGRMYMLSTNQSFTVMEIAT